MKIISWTRQHIIYVTLTILAVVLGVVITWQIVGNSDTPSSKELSSVKAQVGQLILLPKDEEPTLAVVQDVSRLKDEYLKSKAQNGDQILIYTTNSQAIIYRPSINKIVAVSPVTVDEALAESTDTTISILNGTTDPNIASKVEGEIASKYPDAKITTGNANRRDFPTTIIIDNTNVKDNLVESLVGLVKAQRGVVPLSEGKGSSNLIIIVGKDRL